MALRKKLLDFLKKCMYNNSFKRELEKSTFKDFWVTFESIRDGKISIGTKEEFSFILTNIERILALNGASPALLEYFYYEFQDSLDFKEKYELFVEEKLNNYINKLIAQVNEKGGISYNFRK